MHGNCWNLLATAGFAFLALSGTTRLRAAELDPCSLLTTVQVSEALGTAAGASEPVALNYCQWSAGDRKVTILLESPQGFAYAKSAPAAGVERTPCAGLGDDAVFTVTAGRGPVLTVKKSATIFSVEVRGFRRAETARSIEKALAWEILAKLRELSASPGSATGVEPRTSGRNCPIALICAASGVVA